MRKTVVVLVLTCILGSTRRSAAWGADAHRIVARVALAGLTSGAARNVKDLLGSEDFVSAATWADDVRSERPGTLRWHFVTIPIDAQAFDALRDCGNSEEGDCVVNEVTRAYRTLRLDPGLVGANTRKEALKFLIHLAGDLHQPMNCADNRDQGGRNVKVAIAGLESAATSDLHTAWDSTFIQVRGMTEETYTEFLLNDVGVHPVPEGPMDLKGWATESHSVAVNAAYGYPGFTMGSPPRAVVNLDRAYVARAQSVIDRQLELAGVRLGRILNTLFGPS